MRKECPVVEVGEPKSTKELSASGVYRPFVLRERKAGVRVEVESCGVCVRVVDAFEFLRSIDDEKLGGMEGALETGGDAARGVVE